MHAAIQRPNKLAVAVPQLLSVARIVAVPQRRALVVAYVAVSGSERGAIVLSVLRSLCSAVVDSLDRAVSSPVPIAEFLSVAVAIVFSCYHPVSTVSRTSGWMRRMSVLSRWKPLSGMCHSADG